MGGGTITGVTAGTGLTGGGTTGTVGRGITFAGSGSAATVSRTAGTGLTGGGTAGAVTLKVSLAGSGTANTRGGVQVTGLLAKGGGSFKIGRPLDPIIQTDVPGTEVSWQVTGIRQDAFAEKNRIPVEELKPGGRAGHVPPPAGVGGKPLAAGLGLDEKRHRAPRALEVAAPQP